MIEPRKVGYVDQNVEFLKNQIGFFKKKLSEEKKIEAKDNSPEEEKSRIVALLDSHIAQLPKITQQVQDIKTKEDLKGIKTTDFIIRLQTIDEILNKIIEDVEIVTKEQIYCKLENYKREVHKSARSILGLFDFLIPNIKNEITYFKKFYRIPSNAGNTILPELEDLMYNLGNHKISLKEFFQGYTRGKKNIEGFDTLRVKNNVFSRYQSYENNPGAYDEINSCILNICRAIMPFLSEQRTEPEFAKLFSHIEEINRKAANPRLGRNVEIMKDIFELSALFRSMVTKVGKKFSYRDEYKNSKAKIEEFNNLKKPVISYNLEMFKTHEEKFTKLFADEHQKAMFDRIISEVKRYMEEKTLPFDRIDMVFKKLAKKDFNIVILEKEAGDLTIQITPHLAKKFGEDNLKRINIIILEIDFWFPYESKQQLFEEISKVTQKIQADEPIDNKEFMTMMQDFNKEINEKYRKLYQDQIKLANAIVKDFSKIFSIKKVREKLNSRLMDKEAWDEASSRLMKVKRNLAVLGSDHESLKENINKFPFLKGALEDLCQLLYDNSMKLFITYGMADQRSILNMTNILSVYNEFHDAKSVWSAFSHYFHSNNIPNFYANETKVIRLTQNLLCKTEFDKLFPKKKKK